MNICSAHLKKLKEIKEMPIICEFDRILKTKCNLLHFTRNCGIKNQDDFERDEADTYLWGSELLNVKEKGMNTL